MINDPIFVYENGESVTNELPGAVFHNAVDNKVFFPKRWDVRGRPLCEHPDGCNNICRNRGKNHGGYQKVCEAHYRGKKDKKGGYKAYEKEYCENIDGRLGFKCTTTVYHQSMLESDHIDNNHNNHAQENLQTLCGGCHNYKGKLYGNETELKTILNKFAINCSRVTNTTITFSASSFFGIPDIFKEIS
jgi:5-methylcytosine-specific restriction endonuclease McrA